MCFAPATAQDVPPWDPTVLLMPTAVSNTSVFSVMWKYNALILMYLIRTLTLFLLQLMKVEEGPGFRPTSS